MRIVLALVALAACLPFTHAQHPLSTLKLLPGFNISIYAYKNLSQPRQMAVMKAGQATIVFAGTINTDQQYVYALIDYESDGFNDKTIVVKEVNNKYNPGSVAVSPTGELWIGAVDLILRCPNAAQVLKFGPNDRLTCSTFLKLNESDSSYYFHAQRHMQFNKQGEICIAYGTQCNECECHPKWCRINCYTNNDANQPVPHAVGIRNSVGFDWHPTQGHMWFTDNGRDNLNGAAHQNMPDDELNVVMSVGENFGYPYCHSQGYGPPFVRSATPSTPIQDPDIGPKPNCSQFTMAQQPMGPHVAALGVKFVPPTNKMFPASFQNTAIVAQHGSWDRTQKIGYRVAAVHLDAANYPQVASHVIFATGWLDNRTQQVWGRPVDVQWLPDGSLLISDDGPASCIYRVVYNQPVVWDPEFTWATVYPQKRVVASGGWEIVTDAKDASVGTVLVIVAAAACLLLLISLACALTRRMNAEDELVKYTKAKSKTELDVDADPDDGNL